MRASARISLREFARRQGVSHPTVREAIATGRLDRSIGRTPTGVPFIADVALAGREWSTGVTKAAAARSGRRRREPSARWVVAVGCPGDDVLNGLLVQGNDLTALTAALRLLVLDGEE